MTSWTLTQNGTEQSFAQWGLNRVTRAVMSQGLDYVTFEQPGAMDSTPIFPFKSTVLIQRNRTPSGNAWSGGASWFAGLVIQVPRRGSGSTESTGYKIAGPWWYLENKVYELDYKTVTAINGANISYGLWATTHVFLNFAINPVAGKLTTRDQIKLALQCALSPWWDFSNSPPWSPAGGAPASLAPNPPFQIGTIDPAIDVPIDEVKDITCAEVIQKQLRWCPDCVAWFDYRTTPPTFNVTQRANLATVNLSLT